MLLSAAMRLLGRGSVVLALVCVVCLAVVGSSGARISITPGVFGTPPPASQLIQTRLGPLKLASHIVRAGGLLTGISSKGCMISFTPGVAGYGVPCPFNWSGFRAIGKVVSGCGEHDATCSVRIGGSSEQTQGYQLVQLGITNIQGVGISNDYYGVVSKKAALIEGTVINKEKEPVPGAEVDIYGASNYQATTGTDGSYAMQVNPGSYRVVPSGAGLAKAAPSFTPTDAHVSVAAGQTADADFTASIVVIVHLTLSASSVPADGFHIVQGTITVTKSGAPVPGALVALWPKEATDATDPVAAVTKGALATVCNGTTRLWPTGTLSDPLGYSVQVPMDATGSYHFTLDVGTVPGPFSITAWGIDSQGALIPADPADATSTQTLNVTPLIPGVSVSDFPKALNGLKGKTVRNGLTFTNDPGALTASFAALAARNALAGLAFSWINGTNGSTAVLIYPADKPPTFNPKTGVMKVIGGSVLQPAEFATTLINGLTVPDVQTAIGNGALPTLPTFAQWATGASAGSDWKLVPNSATPWSENFLFNGWPYQNTAPGACS